MRKSEKEHLKKRIKTVLFSLVLPFVHNNFGIFMANDFLKSNRIATKKRKKVGRNIRIGIGKECIHSFHSAESYA